MRTFDRAIYGIFLLVLLADVARAGTVAPSRINPAGGVMLNASTHVGVSAEDGSIRVFLGGGGNRQVRQIRLTSSDRELASEFLANYRAAYRAVRAKATQARAMRGMFERLCVETGSTVASLDLLRPASPFDPRLKTEILSLPVVEHSGSPAP